MPERSRTTVWYRSLYWRIALGLVAFLAVMLLAQGLLFLWMTDQIAGSMPARSPRRLAVLVASDIAAALDRDAALDLDVYVRDQYGHVFQPILVFMADRPTVRNHASALPEEAEALIRTQAMRLAAGPRFERRQMAPREGARRPLPPEDGFGLERGPRRRAEYARIIVDRSVVGVVAVPFGRPAFTLLLRELGPTMGLVGGAVLFVGVTLIALVVFGPARRRLKHLQDATERLGAGDLSARAPADGGDEVALLARSFNRMADDLAARAQALDASDRARRQLLADVSHELMTPLTAMRGYIETLGMADLQLDRDTRDRYLRIVDDETQRLERIIGDLLDLARLEGGGGTLRREQLAVANLFERVAARHEREMTAHRIELTRRIDPGAEWLDGDPDRLEQALQNLAANALRHTPDGGVVALTATARNESVVLTVRDSGPGIPTEHLPLIFDRFYKADAARSSSNGSGLGLSIVRAIVERHGGAIEARNDQGAVFEISLPRTGVPRTGQPVSPPGSTTR